MATYLEIVNNARMEAGVAGGDLSTLQGANEENARFASWVRREWSDLQARHDEWQFLRRSFEFDSSANQTFYTPQQAKATSDGTDTGEAILADWKLDSLRISTSGNGYADEAVAGFLPYEQFRNLYLFGSMRAARTKPVMFTVRPDDKALGLGTTPDGAYTVNGEFYRTPQVLSADGDIPLMPTRYHDLLAFLALRAYGVFVAAPEVIGRAEEKIGVLFGALCTDQLPTPMCGPPLA